MASVKVTVGMEKSDSCQKFTFVKVTAAKMTVCQILTVVEIMTSRKYIVMNKILIARKRGFLVNITKSALKPNLRTKGFLSHCPLS